MIPGDDFLGRPHDICYGRRTPAILGGKTMEIETVIEVCLIALATLIGYVGR